MFKTIPNEEFYRLINFGPCVIVTTKLKNKINAAPIAWVMPVNDEPQLLAIAVAEGHLTKEFIAKTKEFVVNVVAKDSLPLIKYFGSVSGRKVDKLRKFNVPLEEGEKVSVPHLKGCVGFIECKLKSALSFDGVSLLIARALRAKVMPGLYKRGLILEKAKIVHHIGKGVFATTGKRVSI